MKNDRGPSMLVVYLLAVDVLATIAMWVWFGIWLSERI